MDPTADSCRPLAEDAGLHHDGRREEPMPPNDGHQDEGDNSTHSAEKSSKTSPVSTAGEDRPTRRIILHPWGYDINTPASLVPIQLLGTFANFLRSEDFKEKMQGTLMIRKMLSVEGPTPLDEVIEHGCVPLFVDQLLHDKCPKLQFQSAWALSCITASTRGCHVVTETPKSIANLVKLCSSPYEDCRDHACWAIGNLAGTDACRVVVDACALPALIAVAGNLSQKSSTIHSAAFALQNIFRHKSFPIDAQAALPALVELLNHKDGGVVVDAAWALSYLADVSDEEAQRVLATGCLPRLVHLLGTNYTAVMVPAIRTVGNFVMGNESQTQAVIDAGALQAFHPLLNHEKRSIREEVYWTISNITAGTRDQLQAVIDADLIPALVVATKDPEITVKKEAAWAIAIAIRSASGPQIDCLVELDVLPGLCGALTDDDTHIVFLALRAMNDILAAGENKRVAHQLEINPYVNEVEICGGMGLIENLAAHTSPEIRELATGVLSAYSGQGAQAP